MKVENGASSQSRLVWYSQPRSLTSVLSMNAAISAAVVLASRLDSDLSVFALVLFSVQTFALFPLLRRQLFVSQAFLYKCNSNHLKITPAVIRALLTGILSTISISLMSVHSSMAGWIVFSTLVFITFVSPALLVWAQRYKK